MDRMSAADLDAVLSRSGLPMDEAIERAEAIVDAVRERGDGAVIEYARRFDGFTGRRLTLPASEIRSAKSRVSGDILRALRLSKTRIERFHQRQVLRPFRYRDDCGTLGQRVVPLDRVGVYVPGGTASYVSSVLMASIPARIAGVREICVCTPGRGGSVPDPILAACELCGVTEVHPVGGAHSIAAMAYGTPSVPRVKKIVGPGGLMVTAAKLVVRKDCEIDFLAGPSEILVIADSRADSRAIASDMLAQLEHDVLARAVLVTTSDELASDVERILPDMISSAARSAIARKAAESGAIFIVAKRMLDAVEFANRYAPEHLLIDTADSMRLLQKIENAGSVFVGRHSSVAFGDYCSGTNHILPTKGAASMRSSLSVYDFLKIVPYQSISARGSRSLAAVVDVLARSEGLPAHAEAALERTRRSAR